MSMSTAAATSQTGANVGESGIGAGAIFSGIGLGLNILSGALGVSANRKSARAQMRALESEKAWNLGVMAQNIIDVRQRGMLESYASGINPMTGSNLAVIENNERVMRNELEFQRSQYDAQLSNLRAQSKQKYLGIF